MFRKKPRFQWGAILGIFLLCFATSNMKVMVFGLPLIICGELIRFWSNGCIVKTKQLTTHGPYAYVRNPLYLGTNVMMIGFCIISGNVYASAVVAIAYYIIYKNQIMLEERDLEEIYGATYRKYKKHVPRIIPNFKRYQFAESIAFELKKIKHNKEAMNAFWVFVLLCAFYIRKSIIS
ncbi:methyltransferase family protein [Candidatus Omnitrophota bacterium]